MSRSCDYSKVFRRSDRRLPHVPSASAASANDVPRLQVSASCGAQHGEVAVHLVAQQPDGVLHPGLPSHSGRVVERAPHQHHACAQRNGLEHVGATPEARRWVTRWIEVRRYTTGSVLQAQQTPYIVITGCAYSLPERPPRAVTLGGPSRPPTPAKSAPELTSMETLSIAESL